MKNIELFEEVLRNGTAKESNIPQRLLYAYSCSKMAGNELIDFAGIIWEYEIEEIANSLKANGVEQFTVSGQSTGLLTSLIGFEECGYKVRGMVDVHASTRSWEGDYENVKAILMSHN